MVNAWFDFGVYIRLTIITVRRNLNLGSRVNAWFVI